jgi:hypothetical protein
MFTRTSASAIALLRSGAHEPPHSRPLSSRPTGSQGQSSRGHRWPDNYHAPLRMSRLNSTSHLETRTVPQNYSETSSMSIGRGNIAWTNPTSCQIIFYVLLMTTSDSTVERLCSSSWGARSERAGIWVFLPGMAGGYLGEARSRRCRSNLVRLG